MFYNRCQCSQQKVLSTAYDPVISERNHPDSITHTNLPENLTDC